MTGPLAHVKVRLAMPRTVPDLCTPRVIVMERLPGEKLVGAVMRYYRQIAESRRDCAGDGPSRSPPADAR
ncbi:hypothetical protein AMAG_18320 [Allomyces macrogynus ATCC 38327]|uniref:Uncharacterized protein n=1 Tax=Allomyces macrogynus (strain ATCC 38327) TaxID=578462 RepID=A0A0L0S8P7_ALLM3|nr:hypothetical protein AMAG_18320 [Allomyces macrogynus ATCC 38327]|eukprot:KNE58852.1 hypothetical protein AMAG_18320 [Allomyces macrogynus ATCC 38327]